MNDHLPIHLTLPKGYLNGETRNGYYVSPEKKKVWAVLLDMLNEVACICKKYDIRWFADGGTMLGAARHGGFIPWDDDIDVRMLRPDYDRFVEVAQKELKHPYFFQTEQTDPGSLRCHAQIRNSETAGMLRGEADINFTFNQGIFLDIFPWDNINDDDELVNQQVAEMREIISTLRHSRYFPIIYWKYKRRNVIAWLFNCVKAWWIRNFRPLPADWNSKFDDIHAIITRYQSIKTRRVGNLSLLQFRNNWCGLREDYDDVVYLPFEMLTIPVPKNYDRVLTAQYGEWKKPLQVPSTHGNVILDTSRSYKVVLREIDSEGLKKWLKRNGYDKLK
ncbi:MAG: LicD family protein [Bacteroidaceae bacterium]|nr:LicD family protein [Bacteroidaceae bacterium]